MKILVANPPWRKNDFYGLRSGCRFPYMTDELTREGVPAWIPFPFTLAQAAALLEKNGFDVELLDCIASGIGFEEFYRRVESFKPDLYIQETAAPSYPNDRAIFEKMRSMLPDAYLATAGDMITGWGVRMLEENGCIDGGLTYEWEETALDLARKLRDRIPLTGTKGLFHRVDGRVIAEERRDPPDVRTLPWAAREKLPMLRYNDDFAFLPVPNLQMYTERGCPYTCSFCVWVKARYGGCSVRFRDPADVADEMAWCIKRWPFKAVYFDDDTFNISKAHVLQLCEEIRKRNITIPWAAMCRADCFDHETLVECRKAGLFAVKYGIESADQAIINGIHKNLNLEKAEKVIAMTRELGIKVHLTLVLGLPGETDQTIRKTWRFVKRVKADYMQFSLSTPYPGTELYEQAAKNGWIEATDWSGFNADSQASMRTDALTREQLEAWIRTLNLRRMALQLINNPVDCLRMYGRKMLNSPKKIANIARSIFRT